MNSFDQLKPLLEDERGLFFEVLNNIEIKHVVVTTFTKNAKRGNQFRKNMDQYFFLAAGKVKVTTKDMKTNEQKENSMIQGSMLFIPKGIAFVTIADEESILVECSPQEYDPNNPDIIMSWAKIFVCLGKYDIAIEKYQRASNLYMDSGRNDWQLCEAQIAGINNRFNEPERFKDFVVASEVMAGSNVHKQGFPAVHDFRRGRRLREHNISEKKFL